MQKSRHLPERSVTGILSATVLLVAGCVNVSIEQARTVFPVEPTTNNITEMVILTRHQQTDAGFAECIGDTLAGDNFRFYPSQKFRDALFPWFEPRIAPRTIDDLLKLVKDPVTADHLRQTGIGYLLWIDGTTETAEPVFWGVGTSWETVSNYEATVWDVHRALQVGKVNAKAKGTSIVLLAFVPVPLIARTKTTACNRLTEQLRELLLSANGVAHPANEQIRASSGCTDNEKSGADRGSC